MPRVLLGTLPESKSGYIASAECDSEPDEGITRTERGLIWLGNCDGYKQCVREQSQAYLFPSIAHILLVFDSYIGMPWYFRPKRETLKVYRVERTVTQTIIEVDIHESQS
jgi:hypothetical protein